MNLSQIRFFIRNTIPFNKLLEPALDEFIQLGEIKVYQHDEVIYNQGDSPDHFYLLLQGRVVALTQQEGAQREIELLKRGTCFGLISLFTGDSHSVTTKAIEESLVFRVDKARFKKFLEKYPLISLDFSQILSQRVKSRVLPKTIFKSKAISIVGFSHSGKTTYMYDLASEIHKQTSKKVMCMEVSATSEFALPNFKAGLEKPLALSEFKEEDVSSHILKGDIDTMMVSASDSANIAALINYLCEQYHFVLYEVPSQLSSQDQQTFFAFANEIHLLTAPLRQQLDQSRRIISSLEKKPESKEKVRVVLSEFLKQDQLSFEQKRSALSHSIYATIPPREKQDYSKALRRIAREVGETIVGLALGSGGAFGFSHVGILKVFEENDIPVDIICGSSIGSFVAALWAAGFKAEDIEKLVKKFAKQMSSILLSGFSFPLRGLLRAKRFEKILKGIFGDLTFYEVKHTLRIVAFDFLHRKSVIISEGPIYKAVAASCAMPGIFEPVMIKKSILLDGGVLNPLPTKTLLNYGAHKIIAINITPSREEIVVEYRRKRRLHIFDFIFGSIETMQRQLIEAATEVADLVIHPSLEGLHWLEFEKVDELIERGRKSALEKIEDLRRLVKS